MGRERESAEHGGDSADECRWEERRDEDGEMEQEGWWAEEEGRRWKEGRRKRDERESGGEQGGWR